MVPVKKDGVKFMHNDCLSLSIVTFNNEKKIEKLISNLTEILNGNISYKLYIIDNGSTDQTQMLVKKIKKNNKNIVFFDKKENLGFGSGHNSIISFLKSSYHIVLNPDIQISSFKEIEKMINYLEKNRNVGLLSPLILNEDGSIQRLYKYNPTIFDLFIRFVSPNFFKKRQEWFYRLDSGYNKIGHIDYASGSFMMFRTSIFKKINGFDERYFMYMEDADITRKVNRISDAVFFPTSAVTHEWQRASHKKIKYILISIESMLKYFNKWGWKWY
ncbi:glycosyltransferase family 2 protein [Pediococcus parvulus]|nr:glycosyltransferase family 2 protein [Pediococcus parvulus]